MSLLSKYIFRNYSNSDTNGPLPVWCMVLCICLVSAGSSAFASDHKKPLETDTAVFLRTETELQEITVRPKKQKYSKKGNPAVELMQRIRRSAKETDPTMQPWYSYDQYDKTTLGLNDFEYSPDSLNKKSTWDFLREYIDTAPATGKQILMLSLKERLASVITSQSPKSRKLIQRGVRSVGIDETFEQQNIRKMLNDALREIDIYSNDIPLLQNRFVSPLSSIGEDYYKYFITDTLDVEGIRCVELSFAPHSPESFSFNGKLFIEEADSNCFIKKVTMRVPRVLNLNFVDNIFITQTFQKDSLGRRHKTLDEISLELQLVPGTPSFYGRRVTTYSDFSFEPSDEYASYYSTKGNEIEEEGFEERTDQFWEEGRPLSLNTQERKMDLLLSRMRSNKVFYLGEKIIRILAKSYVGTSFHGAPSKFDFGPVLSTLSFGEVEGMRVRAGGYTTSALNPYWFARGFLAYGTKDRKFKYRLELERSFLKKKRHSKEFPVHSISVGHEYDLFKIGQKYLQSGGDNILLSLSRMKSILVTYQRISNLTYKMEMRNNLSLDLSLVHLTQEATPWVGFMTSEGSMETRFSQTSCRLQLRYAPGEVFTQGASNRAPINMDAPIFTLTHEYGPKHLFGSRFGINMTEASVFKRFWFSAFGYLDTMVKGVAVWNAVPYTSLPWANANVSYTIQRESYSLLNPMEFANDRMASVDLTYWMNGLVLNRIPLIKKLKLREVITFKGFLGSLSGKNNPASNPYIYRFPEDAMCKQMHGRPYMELGAGLDNIARIFRLDYVWRLTYRNTPCAPNSGLRVSLHLQF